MYAYTDDGVFGKRADKELYWTKKGAELGDTSAMIKLARDYFLGEIVEKNETEQENWLLKAGKAGSAQAYVELSHCGKYVEDKQKQNQLLRTAIDLAGRSGDKDAFESACLGLGWQYKPGEYNSTSDAKKSTYFFVLSYVLGNEHSLNNAKETGYVAPRDEFDSWAQDARNLRVRM